MPRVVFEVEDGRRYLSDGRVLDKEGAVVGRWEGGLEAAGADEGDQGKAVDLGSGQGKALRPTKRVKLDQFPDLLAAVQDLARPALESDLDSYFEGQRRRVRRGLTGQEE